MRPIRAATLLAAFSALLQPSLAIAAGTDASASKATPGAYCALPKKGETPKCLGPAMQEYGEFFDALGEEDVDTADLARVERDLSAGGGSDKAYLALSSLAYGYWRLSQRAAADPEADPAIAAQLEQWNAVLAMAYEASPDDPGFRSAVREAALDVSQRAPAVRLRCVDAAGATSECDSTDAVVRGIDVVAAEAGIGGALQRLFERAFGGTDE
jgi:hypothetical protein